ncbi:hypothetical protein HOLleu_25233 [Holothuria leucospilota]|uniref:Uncharacterized protein n=1 Tax=Holothuria leucospilota TaxID=206669 RepID=A0A9Q1BSB8_HOLLE|nr:hypothetical protein HOLleu_25233 [Holothuria leucospilota]
MGYDPTLVQHRLLVEENVTLDKANSLAQRVEAALKDSNTVTGTTDMNNYANQGECYISTEVEQTGLPIL